jgi:hypothetical protein
MAGVKGRSGGARANVQKPRVVGSLRWRREQRAKRLSPIPATQDAPRPPQDVPRPADLSAQTATVWDALAPHALTARTLTPATAMAFQDLCEAIVLKRAELSRISREGLVVEGAAHPLLSRHVALMVRVEAGMTRFRLIPMGKEMPAAEEKADEFSEFDTPLVVLRGGRA